MDSSAETAGKKHFLTSSVCTWHCILLTAATVLTTFSSRGAGSLSPLVARCYHQTDPPQPTHTPLPRCLAPAAAEDVARHVRRENAHTAPGAPRTSWALADRAALSTIIARTQRPVKADRAHTRARGPAWM